MQQDSDRRWEPRGGLKHGGSKCVLISDVYFLFFVTSSQMIFSTSETTNTLAGICLFSPSSQAVVQWPLYFYGPSPTCGILCKLMGNSEDNFAIFFFFFFFCLRVTPTHSRVCSASQTQAPACKTLHSARGRPDHIQSIRSVENWALVHLKESVQLIQQRLKGSDQHHMGPALQPNIVKL